MSSPSTAPPVPVLCPCCHQAIPAQFRCQACGGPFIPSRAAQKYCGRACCKAQHRRIANKVKNLDQPYLRKPRSPEALEAARLQRERKQEVMFEEARAAQAPDNTIDDYCAQFIAEAEAEERAEGLHDIIRPDPEVPSAVTPLLPPKVPQRATTRAARLRSYCTFTI